MFLSLLNKYFLHSQDGIKNIKNIRNIKNIKMPKCFFFFFLQIFFKWWPSQQTAAWWFLKNIQTFATFSVLVQGVETIVLIWIQWWQKIYYDKMKHCRRMVEEVECTLGRHNFLDVKFFTPSMDECRQHCQETLLCRFLRKEIWNQSIWSLSLEIDSVECW